MPILRILERGTYEPRDIQIMTVAFEEALRRAGVTDRTTVVAERIARHVLAQFEKGERDAKQIAKRAVEN